jgi:hypothetical protein
MIRAMGTGLQAALLLARGRGDGLALLDSSDERAMAVNSFWAMALCLPAFVCLHVLDWAEAGLPAEPANGFALDLMGYVVGWLCFALLSRELAARLGRERRWLRFLAMWNWCNVVQYLMLVVAALPPLLGASDLVTEAVWLIAMGWALWLEWFAARLTLDIPGLPAAGLVAIDLAVGLLISAITSLM